MKCYVGNHIQNSPVGGNSCASTSCIATPTGLLLEHVMEIKLRHGQTTLIDADDHKRVSKYVWNYQISGGYAYRCNAEKEWIPLARFILGKKKGIIVDHINGNRLDNRKKNLRVATAYQNNINRKPNKNKSSVYKGVMVKKRRYGTYIYAGIKKDKKVTHLGIFKTEKIAAMAYDKKAFEYWGEFAYLNFPRSPQ